MTELIKLGMSCKWILVDVDHLIVPTAILIITTTNKPIMVLGTDTDPLVVLVALSDPYLNNSIYILCQCSPMALYSTPQIQNYHSWATAAGFSCPDGVWHNSRTLQVQEKEGCDSSETEDHSYLEAFTKDTNTHDKVGKPLLKIPTSMLSFKGWGSIPSESVWSRAATGCGQVPLHHGQQTHQQIIVIYRIWVTNTASKQCCFTVPCSGGAVVGGWKSNDGPLVVAALWTTKSVEQTYPYGYYDPESQLGYKPDGNLSESNISVDIMVENVNVYSKSFFDMETANVVKIYTHRPCIHR